ncbi:hypothetical protein RvY_09877 [Ramazzottius varieornatus]|uniref:FXNA-like protease n=1 Tax=Ramazzottius varieornatus TaxID=947166 RepID=A0A1D1VG91_RAMVA|nr:hypothetical protein RvY_09877 [Ramazzottius varieornatus]
MNGVGVRKRGVADDGFDQDRRTGGQRVSTTTAGDEKDKNRWTAEDAASQGNMLGWLQWLILGAYIGTVIYLIQTVSQQLPRPWPSSEHGDLRDMSKFSEDRAMQHLLVLTSFRPRTVGTDGNDKFAANYFYKEAQAIKKKAAQLHDIDIDHQIVSGSFRLAFLGGFNSVYRNVHNILVRVSPRNVETNRTLLVNCHFDAAIGVDGASDDLSQCVIMLDTLAVLARRGALPGRILFLFNGAEESILQASHGFVTQHPWAKEVTAFVNLEAAGSGGRDVLFQTGPKHPWLVRAYARVPYPCGNSVGEEIFQSGAIPSDTDFRIFRDHGHIPGVDIAFVENGYVYHTHYDQVDQIYPGTLQRAGENLLALLYGMVTSAEFQDLENCKDCATDSAVYFDFIGLAFIMYSHTSGIIANYFFAIAATFIILLEMLYQFKNCPVYLSRKDAVSAMIFSFLLVLCSIIVPVSMTALLAYLLSMVAPMSWFSRTYLTFFLYALPTIAVSFALHWVASHTRLMMRIPVQMRESIVYHAVGLIWIVLLVGTTLKGLNSAFLPMLFVAAPIPVRFIWLTLQPLTRHDLVAFLTTHMTSYSISSIFALYQLISVVKVFLPMFGRTGSEVNPDVLLAVIVSSGVMSILSYYTSLIHVTKRQTVLRISQLCALLTLITVLTVSLTSMGFPYSSPPDRIAPKRMIVQHLHREEFNLKNEQIIHENALWIVPLDFTGLQPVPLADIISLTGATKPDCDSKLYCGLPFIYPVMNMLKQHLVVPIKDEPRLPHHPLLKKTDDQVLVSDDQSLVQTRRLTFVTQLVDHSNIHMSPAEGCELRGWNLTQAEPMQGPTWHNRTTYFVFLVSGYDAKGPMYEKTFHVDISCPKTASRATDPVADDRLEILTITVINHFLTMTSPVLDKITQQLPSWLAPITWLNSIQTYSF